MNLFGTPPDNKCGVCDQELEDGQAIYTLPDKNGRQRHYDCWERECSPKALRLAIDKLVAKGRKLGL